jgi:CheY-like chemotaxis protein
MINIMLVEDDKVDVMAVQRMFKENHVINPLYIAANGLEALVMLHEQNCKSPVFKESLLILLDFYMPKMNGLEFLAELQLNPDFREIPVIIFITSEEMKIQVETNQLNIVGYLSKPIIFSELTKIVKSYYDTLNKSYNSIMLSAKKGQARFLALEYGS